MKLIDVNYFKKSEFFEVAYKYWYNDNQHIRSPFPEYIQNPLKEIATEKFLNWLNNIHPDAENEFNDEIIAEKFEEILFETALSMVRTEDERITILYPFLPRKGDKIKDDKSKDNIVSGRTIKKDKDNSYLNLKCENLETKSIWETSVLLPS
ncbi:MAG TPA: hypothetical protein PK611_06800 [Saprospiraceae bacterium]|jgi:hypothetical protein|nr:hypothetical protein [Saprospiraceae bacterium]HRO07336.1 hypothetical protein [Saprospiraceae bacterium]HRO73360.1 hypothetical protein [Saprospiraceae bacterium]HRP40619.1 hypothetical protein [Saprospiraceae bacterium]